MIINTNYKPTTHHRCISAGAVVLTIRSGNPARPTYKSERDCRYASVTAATYIFCSSNIAARRKSNNMKALLFLLSAAFSSAALVRREAEAEAEPAYGFDVNGGRI